MIPQRKPKVNRDEAFGLFLLSSVEKNNEQSRQMADVAKTIAKFAKDSWDKIDAFLKDVDVRINKRLAEIKDGKDGEKGDKGDKGDKGEQGEQGEQGERGEKGERGENGKDGSPDTGDQIIQKINEANELIEQKAIEGLGDLQKELEKVKEIRITGTRSFFGAKGIGLYIGGAKKLLTAQQINLVAGSNVSIVYNHANGRNDITISATGGSGAFSLLIATGTINDTNTSFTFASEPTIVVVNGASYRHGSGVTISGVNVTLDNPVGQNGDIYGLG